MADATNVKIVISAITEAAQEAIDEVGDDLQGIVDDAAVGQQGLEEFQSELQDTVSRAAIAGEAIDELGDEFDQTTAQAVLTQDVFDEVGDEALTAAQKSQVLNQAQESLGDEFDQTTAKALVAQEAVEAAGTEAVESAVDAQALKQAQDALGDEFSEATAKAVLAQTAIDEVGDEAIAAAGKTELLKMTQESLGDEFSKNTAKALTNAGALQTNAASATAASGSFGLLNTTMLLSLIPTILTLATVLAPIAVLLGAIAAGAIALAGAFGLIIGSGILAFGQERAQQNQKRLNQINSQIGALERLQQSESGLTKVQKRRLKRLKEEKEQLEDQTSITGALGAAFGDLKDEILPLITQFGQEFIPLIEDALAAIPTLVEEMLAAVGGTDEFREALRRFGALMMEVLPALVGLMFDLARVALPVFEDFVAFLQGNGEDALGGMQESLDELTPEFQNLLDALIEMGPVLLEFGTNVAEVVLPALTFLIRGMTQFMEVINALPDPLNKIATSVLLLVPLFVKFGGLLTGLLPSAFQLGKAFGYIVRGGQAIAGALSGSLIAAAALGAIIGLLVVKIMDMLGVFDMIEDGASQLGQKMGGLVDPFLTFLSVITLGIFPALAALGGLILGLVRGDLSAGVENAKEILGIFGDAFWNTYDMIVGAFNAMLDAVLDFIGLSRIPDAIMRGLGHIDDLFVRFFLRTFPNTVVRGFRKILQWVIQFGPLLVRKVGNAFGKIIQKAVQWGGDLLDKFKNGVMGFNWGQMGADLLSAIADEVQDVIDAAYQWGKEIGQEIAEGIKDAPGAVGEAIADEAAAQADRIPGSDTAGDIYGGAKSLVPELQTGGFIEKTGLAFLHEGERVLPPDHRVYDVGDSDPGDMRAESRPRTGRGREMGRRTTVQGGITVHVEGNDFGRNPREDSRTFAEQLRRELRSDTGAQ